MSETERQTAILGALAIEPGVCAFRNNTGAVRRHGRVIRFGLGVGSADIIAIVAPHGRFVALEVKDEKGETSDAQDNWQRVIEAHGGVYAVVRTIFEALAAVRRARKEAA